MNKVSCRCKLRRVQTMSLQTVQKRSANRCNASWMNWIAHRHKMKYVTHRMRDTGQLPILLHLSGFLLMESTHIRSEEHTSELQSRGHLVCRLLLEKKKNTYLH